MSPPKKRSFSPSKAGPAPVLVLVPIIPIASSRSAITPS